MTLVELSEEVNKVGFGDGGFYLVQFKDGSMDLDGHFNLAQLELVVKWLKEQKEVKDGTTSDSADSE